MAARTQASAVMATLGVAELTDLIRYARAHGRFWKRELNEAWASGRDEREVDASALRRVRNTVGPSGLMKFALNGLEAELAARGGAA
ncbi:hypothetical protein [Methylobacterium sp. J-070]|uniref:hypothetical protein n=1 Tax=Methylobacterium sp. J-070 TaxID=2836650 RepID=UPI001FB8C81D|nr:hypothetical protein [Methylobacterium sp. J-070]MCJ2051681.1 hypothetical protein [Methylobacterium sp. J-070]